MKVIRIRDDLHEYLTLLAKKEGRTIQWLAENALAGNLRYVQENIPSKNESVHTIEGSVRDIRKPIVRSVEQVKEDIRRMSGQHVVDEIQTTIDARKKPVASGLSQCPKCGSWSDCEHKR